MIYEEGSEYCAGYEAGYKDGESSGYADAVAKYQDEIHYLEKELRDANREIEYLNRQLYNAETTACNCGEGW